MKYIKSSVEDIKIAYIGGGSRGWAWTFMMDIALEPSMSGAIRLYDIDQEAASNNEVIGNLIDKRPEAVGHWAYKTVNSLKEALTDADFVVISILPGTFDEMAVDVHEPEAYGIYQSVGDTVGPGGLMRALRTIPMFVEIAEAIKAYAPDSWVINYTNPMSMCIKALYRTFPEIKAFGCCHEVFGTQKVLSGIAQEALGIEQIDRKDINVNVIGINHFTWFNYASYKGIDLFPLYNTYIDQHISDGYTEEVEHWANKCFACAHLVKFDLFKRYGLIAAAGDRHLAEFMPGEDYLKTPEVARLWKYDITTVSWRKEDCENRVAKAKRLYNKEEQLELKPSGEEGILLIKALCGLDKIISNVNVPNTQRQIGNISPETIVETNAIFERDSIRVIHAGDVPEQIIKLLKPHIDNQELVYKAAISCDYDMSLRVLKNDPLVKGRISDNEADELLRKMIKGTKKYLPDQWNKVLLS